MKCLINILQHTCCNKSWSNTFFVALAILFFSLSSYRIDAQNITEGGAQFHNYGFEEWALFDPSDSTSNEPLFWHAYMSAYGEYNPLQNAKYQQIRPSEYVRPGASGTVSAKIYARDVLGIITAIGGITNGRIHVGSTSMSDISNFNITLRDNEVFNTQLGMYPDSLTVWVAFCCEYANQQARVRAIVHGDEDFSECADGSFNLPEMYCGEAFHFFTRTNAMYDTLNYHWIRLSVPFTYDGPCTTPDYVLFTMATNRLVGQGLGNEFILIDDLLMIYNPSLKLGELDFDRIVSNEAGTTIKIPYILSGTMSPSNLNNPYNVVSAQLSDSVGNFDDATVIGQVTSNESGEIEAFVPPTIPLGRGYRIRVTSTNYPLISNDNGFDITIDTIVGMMDIEPPVIVYPTITTGKVWLSCQEPIVEVAIYSVSGSCIRNEKQKESIEPIEMDLFDLPAGFYLIIVSTRSSRYSSKVIKK